MLVTQVSELPKDLDLDSYSEEEPGETSDHEDELDVIVPQYSDEEVIVQIGELDDQMYMCQLDVIQKFHQMSVFRLELAFQ